MVHIKINGTEHQVSDRTSILDAARSVGIDIPTLCHDERLKPAGACRLCLVQVNGEPHETASCMRRVSEGMEVETRLRDTPTNSFTIWPCGMG